MRTDEDRKVIPSANPTKSKTANPTEVVSLTFDPFFKVIGHRKFTNRWVLFDTCVKLAPETETESISAEIVPRAGPGRASASEASGRLPGTRNKRA